MLKSAGGRFFVVGVLALLMYIPMLLVGGVIDDRSSYSRSTISSVGEEWGGRQTINGPVLVVPVTGPVTRKEQREVTDPATGAVTTEVFEVTEVQYKPPIYVLPTRYDASFDTVTEERKRGLFTVPVYSADLGIDFTYDLSSLSDWARDGEQIIWARSFLQVGLTSNKALRGAASLTIDGAGFPLEPLAAGRNEASGIRADLGDPRAMKAFHLGLVFNGAETLQITPVGRVSNVQMKSDWPHPSFFGAYLPNQRNITEAGFAANWSIPHLARNLPQIAREDSAYSANEASFGVQFFQPNDFYQKAYRAARYGILFIALTFLTVLLIEIRQEKKAHPVQYVLIGLAQAIFVLLMVAYAEQIGFAYAYLLASVATVGLITFYGLIGLKLGRRTWVLGTMLVVLYALLYLILRSADYALLAGSTLAFAALGGTMIATRNEDWSGPPSTGKARFWGRKAEAKKDAIDANKMIPADAAARRAVKPVICYPTDTLPQPDMTLYDAARVGAVKVSEVLVQPREAAAIEVPEGHFLRMSSVDGPQVGDLNLFAAGNLAERFYSGKTRALHGTHITTGDRMWSNFPYLRPMATVCDDTLGWYGMDEFGGSVHDVIGTRCDPYTGKLLSGDDYHHCCHSNLTRALADYTGLSLAEAEPHVHDVMNLFMCTGFTRDTGQYFMKASPVREGDYLELFAEIDLVAVLSACPGGDCASEHTSDTATCHPLRMEVFAPVAGKLEGWAPPEVNAYDRTHGR